MTEDHARLYREEGYFVVDDAVDPEMLQQLQQALRRVADKVRSGAWWSMVTGSRPTARAMSRTSYPV